MKTIDLRSDTITWPTEEMRQAVMVEAEDVDCAIEIITEVAGGIRTRRPGCRPDVPQP